MTTKYLFLTGGVVSSVGKGVTAAAIGRILKERGFSVSIQYDPAVLEGLDIEPLWERDDFLPWDFLLHEYDNDTGCFFAAGIVTFLFNIPLPPAGTEVACDVGTYSASRSDRVTAFWPRLMAYIRGRRSIPQMVFVQSSPM